MSQITARRCLFLHPCEAGTCLQLPHFRAHPCPQKPRAILALSPQSGFPTRCPELQHIPGPPHGAERGQVTHQNGKGQLTPPNPLMVSSTGLGTSQSTAIQSPPQDWEGRSCRDANLLLVGPSAEANQEKALGATGQAQGTWLDPPCGLIPQSWHPAQDPEHSPSRSLKVKFTMGSSERG